MGHGQAFSGGLHPVSEAGGLNWRRRPRPSKPPLAGGRADLTGVTCQEAQGRGSVPEGGGKHAQQGSDGEGKEVLGGPLTAYPATPRSCRTNRAT